MKTLNFQKIHWKSNLSLFPMNSQPMGFLCQISISHIWPEAGPTQIAITHYEAIAIAREIWLNLRPRWFAGAETLLISKVAFGLSIYLFFATHLG